MKKIFFTVLLLLTIFLSGCARAVQLSEKLLVQGIGIDYKSSEYIVTLQTIDSKESSSEKSSTPKKVKTVSANGKTIKEASHNIVKQTGKEPLYSQTLILILGKTVIEHGINNIIDFFIRHHEFSPDTRVLVTLNDANKILNVKDGEETVSSEDILAMLEEGPNKSKKLHSNLENIIGDLKDKNSFVKIAMIDLMNQNLKEVLTIERLGIFEGDKYVDYLTKEETYGALFIHSKAKDLVDTISTSEFPNISYTVSKAKTKIKLDVKQENIKINLIINLEVDINESVSEIAQKDFANVEKEISHHTESLCHQAIEKSLIKNKCDIFEFSKLLIKEKPKNYNLSKGEIIEKLKNSKFEFTVETKLCNV